MSINNHTVASESLDYLANLEDRAWNAYPVSWLPYPKETIRNAILSYAQAEGPQLPLDQHVALKRRFALLAKFIDDSSAGLVNAMAKRDGFDRFMQQTRLMPTIPLPDSIRNTSYRADSLKLIEKINTEEGELYNQIQTVLEHFPEVIQSA